MDDSVEAIQNELYTNGPLEVSFEVYEDFLNYDGGIYVVSLGHNILYAYRINNG